MDGCRGGWLVATAYPAERRMEFALVEHFALVAGLAAGALACAVDMPIGLRTDFTPRPCDVAARALLGRQASSIFLAPPRALLGCRTQSEASKLSRAACGRGVSIQAFHLFAKIAEVDAALPAPVREAHPELAFRTRSRVLPGKKMPAGYAARRELLNTWQGIPDRAAARRWGPAAQPDDVLDAAVLAEVAWLFTKGEARHVGDPAEAAIWY